MLPGSNDRNLVTGINVTPLVDITLVLLIIFMVTATFISEQAFQVHLPKVVKEEKAPHPALVVTLGPKGELMYERKDTDLGHLTQELTVETGVDPEVKVIVKADKDITYEKLAEVLDACKKGGVQKVALAVERK
ncbi:MAG TPA: biopolymer transporter ExbD [bacterium]|nr:biopolymer transporter ExbD [bacterium]